MMEKAGRQRQIHDEERGAIRMNNVAGIDVSKGKSVVSVLRPFGEVVAKRFLLVTPAVNSRSWQTT